MPLEPVFSLGPLARAALALLLAATAGAATAADSQAPSVAPGESAGTRAIIKVLPPVAGAGSNSAAPQEPQGLGIGSASASDMAAAAGSMALALGTYNCELNRQVVVREIAPDGKSMVISWLGKDHSLAAVNARSGALRYEDTAAGLTWLVIVGKSMLLDTRKGQQLANECRL
jgi:hypothetical protein